MCGDVFSLGGEDFGRVNTNLTFQAGQTSESILISIVNDDTAEINEEFELLLSSPTNGLTMDPNGIATVVIFDDDRK